MTTLICSGTLFSDWRDTLKKLVSAESFELPAHTEISELAKEICQQQYSDANELGWIPFTPDNKYLKKASQLLSSVKNEPLFTWADNNNCLYLNFCKTTSDDARFVLFYSSPEFELSNYLSAHSFDASRVEEIIDAWVIRTQAMLTFFMNNRDRCLLVDVQSAFFMSDEFIDELNEKFELALEPFISRQHQESTNSPLVEYLATTLLLKNQDVSELYDEVRSAATLLSGQNKSILNTEERTKSLIGAFLTEVDAHKQLSDEHSELEDEIALNQLQTNQMAEELEYYFKKSVEQEKATNTMAEYLCDDPLLRIARHVRQMQ